MTFYYVLMLILLYIVGKDVTIVSYSRSLVVSLEAADILAQQGINCEVINLLSLRPLDRDAIINSVMKTNHLVTVEGCWPQFGIGAEISASIVESKYQLCINILSYHVYVHVRVYAQFYLV